MLLVGGFVVLAAWLLWGSVVVLFELVWILVTLISVMFCIWCLVLFCLFNSVAIFFVCFICVC